MRLPKAYRFEGQQVRVKHFGNGVLLLPVDQSWALREEALNEFEPDFQLQREQPDEQVREELEFYCFCLTPISVFM